MPPPAETFSLLTCLGNGSKRVQGHTRFGLGVYQSGSVLICWDYTNDRKKLIPLLPNQWCESLFFAQDGLTILGVWVSQSGHPTLTVWRVADGEKVAEQILSETTCSGAASQGGVSNTSYGGLNNASNLNHNSITVGPTSTESKGLSSPLAVAFGPETGTMVLVQKGTVGFATVLIWDSFRLGHQKVAVGHIGRTDDVIGVRILNSSNATPPGMNMGPMGPNGPGCSFITFSHNEVRFYSYAERTVRLVSRVLFKQSISQCLVYDGVLYLLAKKKGKILCLSFEGALLATVAYPGVKFTAFELSNNALILGSEEGDIYLYSLSRLELRNRIDCPLNLTSNPRVSITSLNLGMNHDYLFASFVNSTIGVLHIPTGTYTALRLSHLFPLRRIMLAPPLEMPVSLGHKLVDPAGHCLNNAVSFVSAATGDTGFITWLANGAPFRTIMYKPHCPHEFSNNRPELESFAPGPHMATHLNPSPQETGGDPTYGEQLRITTLSFRQSSNYVAMDGRLNRAYQLLVAADDGCLYLYEYEDGRKAPRIGGAGGQFGLEGGSNVTQNGPLRKFSWTLTLVRPMCQELKETAILPLPEGADAMDHHGQRFYGDFPDPMAGYNRNPDNINLNSEEAAAVVFVESDSNNNGLVNSIGNTNTRGEKTDEIHYELMEADGIHIPGLREEQMRKARAKQPSWMFPLRRGPGNLLTQGQYAAAGTSAAAIPTCCHIDFSAGSEFVITTYSNGFSEMLYYPRLHRSAVIQPVLDRSYCSSSSSASSPSTASYKNFFVAHPNRGKTNRDSLQVVSQASTSELVFFELYRMGSRGDSWAKTTISNFVIGSSSDSEGIVNGNSNGRRRSNSNGNNNNLNLGDDLLWSPGKLHQESRMCLESSRACITDFLIHPSKLYLLVTATIQGLDHPKLYVYDLWGNYSSSSGTRILWQTTLFSSSLISSLAPLRPKMCFDATGSFLFCASTPAWVGSFMDPSGAISDNVNKGPTKMVSDNLEIQSYNGNKGLNLETIATNATAGSPPIASILCVLDFKTGALLHQITVDLCCISLASARNITGQTNTNACDPTQLYLGSHDGSIAIWTPPDSIRTVIKQTIGEARRRIDQKYAGRGGLDSKLNKEFEANQSLFSTERALEEYWLEVGSQTILWDRSRQMAQAADEATKDELARQRILENNTLSNSRSGSSSSLTGSRPASRGAVERPPAAPSGGGPNKFHNGPGNNRLAGPGGASSSVSAQAINTNDVVVMAREGLLAGTQSVCHGITPPNFNLTSQEGASFIMKQNQHHNDTSATFGGGFITPKSTNVTGLGGRPGALPFAHGAFPDIHLPLARPLLSPYQEHRHLTDPEGNSAQVVRAPELGPNMNLIRGCDSAGGTFGHYGGGNSPIANSIQCQIQNQHGPNGKLNQSLEIHPSYSGHATNFTTTANLNYSSAVPRVPSQGNLLNQSYSHLLAGAPPGAEEREFDEVEQCLEDMNNFDHKIEEMERKRSEEAAEAAALAEADDAGRGGK